MAKYIDAEQTITVTYYDEEHEEWSKKSKTIYDFLDENADEVIQTVAVVNRSTYESVLEELCYVRNQIERERQLVRDLITELGRRYEQ